MGSEERQGGLAERWGEEGSCGWGVGGWGGSVRGGWGVGGGGAVPVKQLIILPFCVFDLVLNFEIYNYIK